MKLGRTRSVALVGLDGALVDVEADLVQGLPQFMISGLPDAACKQSPDRIKAAAANSGMSIPNRRLTVNLSPASMPKAGSGFDLPIAIAVLAAAGLVPAEVVAPMSTSASWGWTARCVPSAGCCRRCWPRRASVSRLSWCRPTTPLRPPWCPA